jgi:Mrp family chromosome partitioning ATPase
MSSIYEALLKARQERPNLEDSRDGIHNHDGRSFLIELESLFATATNQPHLECGIPTSPAVSPIANMPEACAELPCQIVISEKPKSPEGITSLHGFRRLILPHEEQSRLVFRSNPHGSAADRFRFLSQTVREEFDTGAVLMITSPGAGDGKTLTSLNLSACLAERGDPTLLVELDLRRGAIGEVLGCAMEPPGIEDAFAGVVEPCKVVNFIGELSFHAAVVTKISDDPGLINRAAVARFLSWAKEHFRWVVLDAVPVFPGRGLTEFLPFASAVLLVVRSQSTPQALTRRAVQSLGKSLHGVILNEARSDR